MQKTIQRSLTTDYTEKVNDDWDRYDDPGAADKNALTAILEQQTLVSG